jgi:hypothetical protein
MQVMTKVGCYWTSIDFTKLTSEFDPEVMVCVTACLEQILVTTPNGYYFHLEARGEDIPRNQYLKYTTKIPDMYSHSP